MEKNKPNCFQSIQLQDECIDKIKKDEVFAKIESPLFNVRKERTDICKELKEFKLNDFLERKRRQILHSNSNELRQLKAQLQSALVFKQLKDHQDLLEQQKKEQLLKKREEDLKFAADCAKAREDLVKEDQEKKLKKEVIRSELTKQVDEHRQRRRLQFEDVIKEKEKMEKLIKRVQKEEAHKRENNKRLQDMYREDIKDFCHNREFKKQLEKQHDFYEHERFMAYQKKCDELKEKVAAEKKIIRKEKEALSERLGQQLSSIHNEKKKREDLMLSLLQEERKAKEDENYRKHIENQIKLRQDLHAEQIVYQNEIRIQKEKQFKEEEEKLRQEHSLYLAERDKIYQLSDEMRRRKKLEHNKALREIIELRRIQRAKQISDRISEYENLMAGEIEREKLIEMERIRMLSTTPKELLKYLPPGVLKLSDEQFLTLPD